ncbi:MAG: alkaline phosphatase family protein, partial [Xanthomonadales bacterium]|nr:alkaline phosphatase family protein [Xanthomonadales bacterium]
MFLRFLILSFLAMTASALLLSSCGAKRDAELIFIGIDGAEWDLIDALIDQGELPNFARLKAEGAWGHLINTGPLSSPVAWTTFSTGHFARQHGILDFTYPYTPGTDKRPVNALDKRKPDLWDIASRNGRRISVVGYFVSHPAEPINGVMISDRATQYLPGSVTPPAAVRTAEIDWAEKGA